MLSTIDARDYLYNIPQEGSSLSCVTGSGNKYFLKARQRKVDTNEDVKMCLLSEPVEALMFNNGLRTKESIHEDVSTPVKTPAASGEQSLWVDKYSPRAFTQLLSNEKTNRQILSYLKEWDSFVFRRSGDHSNIMEIDSVISAVDEAADPQRDDSDDDMIVTADTSTPGKKDPRPKHKALLLCGPPGSGKTTLSHIAARHCGYNRIEINASDDRSAEILFERVTSAMGGNAIGGENHSTTPNCVILDEIDGVDNKAAIEMLCTMLKAPLLPPNKRSGKYSVPVTRPIICICNDPYVPALRSLRKLCKVFVFQSPVETRLVQRLKQICTAEGLKDMSTSALMNLCTMHGNDIRSCINTLQFSVGSHVHGSQSSSATLQRNLQLGVKDEQLNVFHLWRAIFSKKDAIAMLHHESVKAGHAEQVKAADSIGFLSIVEEFGDDSLVLNGVHENLLDVPFIDPCMTKTAEVYDWLSLADTHASPGSAHASYGSVASSFVGAAVVATHNAAAVDRRVSLTWPRKDVEVYYRKQELKAMVQQWLQQLHARNRMCENLRDLTMFVMDACSPLVQILHPRMRAYHGASLISMAKEDRATIDSVAGRMAAYGLTFRTVDSVTPPMKWPHKNQEESTTKEMVWEPDLTQLMKSFTTDGALMRKVKQSTRSTISSSSQRRLDGVFQELRPCPRWLSTEVQTMIQTEIKKNVVREKIYGVEKGDASIPVVASTKASTPSKMLPMPANTPPVPAAPSRAHLGKVDAFFKKTTPAEKRKADSAVTDSSSQVSAKRPTPSLYFKFSRGSTNAVRKSVTMAEFM